MLKYKYNLKDINLADFKVYLLAMFKAVLPKSKLRNLEDLKKFIQQKSAWVTQVTLYNYLKTRMGTRYVLHFDNEVFLSSINKAKWNIYYVALQDLTFYSFSYLNYFFKYEDTAKSKMIYEEILHDELKNGMPDDIIAKGKATFDKRLEEIDWKKYFTSLSFNKSALALYEWAPIAEELKTLDRKIVLNSICLLYTSPSPRDATLSRMPSSA